MFPIKHVRILDLLVRTIVSPPEIPHKSGRTLMSLQECEIARCNPNQLEMTTDSPAQASEQYPISIIQDKCLDFLCSTTEIP